MYLFGDVPSEFLADSGELVGHHLGEAEDTVLDEIQLAVSLPLVLPEDALEGFVITIHVFLHSPNVQFESR